MVQKDRVFTQGEDGEREEQALLMLQRELSRLQAALKPVFEDAAHNKELGAWFAVRLVGCADPLKLELGIAWECSHQGAPALRATSRQVM